LVGIMIVGAQFNIQKLFSQQERVFKSQLRLEKMLLEAKKDQKIAELEKRVAELEGQWNKLKAVFQGLGQGQGPQAPQPPQEDFSKVYDIPVMHSFVRGNKDAAITIVEFVDFQCPFSARFYGPLKETLQAYPQDVQFILKNFPLDFHPQAKPAAKAAFAAGEQGKYYEMADMILENARELSDAKYKEFAEKLGLDVAKFEKDFKEKDAAYEDMIQKDMELGNNVDVRGTPTFYLNGKKTMARSLDAFKKEIDEILKNKK
ncbi:MAG TPA: thioredoxin domain-containing protein, partial [Candidatus Omnitrophota bacterium]|nr:thioredoxin domain-containing protein [Candidatus Omnitrophota bacterium]